MQIDQIKYPPLGFEDAIREHFTAKGDEILKKVREWEAEDTEDDFQDVYQLRQEAIVAYSSEQLQAVLDKMIKLRERMLKANEIEVGFSLPINQLKSYYACCRREL